MLATPSQFKPARCFGDVTAPAPSFTDLEAAYAALHRRLDDASGPVLWLEVFRSWDDLRRNTDTWSNLVELRFQQDTTDAQAKADLDLLNALRPKITGLDNAIKSRFLASTHRRELEREIGEYAFALWEADVTSYAPAVEKQSVLEAQLCDQYVELLARASFEIHGERLNLTGIGKFSEHPDRDVRRAAADVKWGFFGQHRAELDRIYGDLVALRHEMAERLGFTTFVELGYRRMLRTDYGPADVSRYRDEIVREIVPLAERIVERQAKHLGIERVMLWDEHIFEAGAAPTPPQAYDSMMDAARNAFANMGERIGSFGSLMIDGEYLDLQNRSGKAGGGFCTSFPTYGLPFIFANFNGTTHDVNVLVHEMGHAFQNYSSRGKAVMEYLWPTYEACEVHSISMEFLTWPQLELFFDGDAARYRLAHLQSSLLFLPYGAAVDHFQHLVYEHPDATPEERHAYWKQMEARYLPWRRYEGIEHLERGGFWQHQRHIYQMPFYYIDYTLAMGCALQFWVKSLDDYSGALSEYISLCARGGDAPFQRLVRSAGLRSPFESGVLRSVAERAASILALP
ncbi:MAG: M3 family oligoendopeptidase [Vulcanimicrobiaceae bacterium]